MLAFLAGCLSLFGSARAGVALFAERPAAALAFHLLAAGAGFLACRLQADPDHPVGLFEGFVALAVPCIGGPLAWLHVLGHRHATSAHVSEEFQHYVDAAERLGQDVVLAARSRREPNPDALENLDDILRADFPVEEKRLAIENLALMDSPQSVAILRTALSSPSTEVRFYAASVLAGLEERLALRLQSLESDVLRGARTGPGVMFELAQGYFDFAYYGLVEGQRLEEYLASACEHATQVRAQAPSPAVDLLLGRILLLQDDPERAEAAFTRACESETPQAALMWRAEARFHLRRFTGVREDCLAAAAAGPPPPALDGAIRMWTDEEMSA